MRERVLGDLKGDRAFMDRQPMRIPVLDQLRAMEKALTDPGRLVEAVSGTEDDAEAIEALCRAFEFTEPEARAVLDQQFRSLTRKGLAALVDNIARFEAEAAEQAGSGNDG